MIIERWVPSLVFHHQPKQTTSLDVSTKARSLDAGGPESSLPPDGGVEVLHLGDLRRRNPLDARLRDGGVEVVFVLSLLVGHHTCKKEKTISTIQSTGGIKRSLLRKRFWLWLVGAEPKTFEYLKAWMQCGVCKFEVSEQNHELPRPTQKFRNYWQL